MQGYAGTASPITFNGLVRQYYMRADAEQGDLQVNLVDKQHRHEQSHAIAQRLRPELEKIAARHGARLKVVEVPPGPPVMSPLVAEVYGPSEAGRQQLAGARGAGLRRHARHHGARHLAARRRAARLPARAAPARRVAGHPGRARWRATVQGALSGTDAAWLHDGQSKYPVPVRLQLPREAQVGLDALLALPLRAANGQLVPLSELVRVERGVIDKPLFTKDLMGVSYVFGDVGAGGATPDSPLYGLFAIRGKLAGSGAAGQRRAGRILDQPARRPLPRVRHQVGRRVADHLRDLPRHGRGLRRGPDPDLPAGGGAVQELQDAADHHGADPADHHRRDAGARAVRRQFHRHLDDRHDRAGRHHRAQLDPAGGLHRAAGQRRAWPSRTRW